jgi:DNA repair protein RadC
LEVEAVIEEVRTLWAAVGQVEPSRRPKLYGKIVKGVERLKKQVHDQLPESPSEPATYPLFHGLESDNGRGSGPIAPHGRLGRLPEPILRLYDKDLADQALAVLPQASRFSDVESFREHLAGALPFNAESTRRRAATYLTGRFFPCGIIHEDLARFAAASEGRPWLGDVLFYLTCRVEKIVASVADEIVWPSLADGGVPRKRITDYVGAHVSDWSPNSVKDVGAAIVRTYERLGIGAATKTRLNVASRKGGLPAFAYILHLEFHEPGMFPFERLIQGPMRRWLLWDPEWMIKQLYACGEVGLIAKVSEIDGTRQFTTKYHLDEAVGPIVSLIR